jgi:hypothetical protein
MKAVFAEGKPKKRDGTEMNDAAVGRALGRVDQAAIIDAADAAVETVEWDRVSDINGKTASEVLALRDDIPPPPAKVYLIRNVSTGKVIMFQPFKPGVGGRQSMTDQAEFDTIKEDERSKMANARATQMIKRQFQDELEKE